MKPRNARGQFFAGRCPDWNPEKVFLEGVSKFSAPPFLACSPQDCVSPAYAFTMSSSDYPDTVVYLNQISDQLVIASDTNIVAASE